MQTGNWTVDQAREVISLYENGNGMSIPDIANTIGRSPHSIRGKLVAEKVYKKKT